MVKEASVQLNLAEELASDEEFRKHFFRLQVQNDIAQQIIQLRSLRRMRQIDLALLSQMKQSAISRVEQADYGSWNYQTLLRVVEALDARLKVVIEPIEQAINGFKEKDDQSMASLSTASLSSEVSLLTPLTGKASGGAAGTDRAAALSDSHSIKDGVRSLVA